MSKLSKVMMLLSVLGALLTGVLSVFSPALGLGIGVGIICGLITLSYWRLRVAVASLGRTLNRTNEALESINMQAKTRYSSLSEQLNREDALASSNNTDLNRLLASLAKEVSISSHIARSHRKILNELIIDKDLKGEH